MSIYIVIVLVILIILFTNSSTSFLNYADKQENVWGGQSLPIFGTAFVTQEDDPGNNPQPCETTRVWYEGCEKDGDKWKCNKYFCNRPGFCKTCQSGLNNPNRNDCVRCSDLTDDKKWPHPPDRQAWFSAVHNAETTPFTSDTNIPLIGPWSYIN